MTAEMTVTNSPPRTLTTVFLRATRSTAITTPRAIATNAIGPVPVSSIARLSRRMSTGLGGCSGGCGGVTGFARGEHQVVEDPRGQARLQSDAVHALKRDVAVVGVLDPAHRDVLVVRGRL